MVTCSRRTLRLRAFLAMAALSGLFGRPALAQKGDPAAARPLFDEARQLMSEGRYVDACPKLEAAKRLYAGSGVLLNLGDCYEHTNHTASAWGAFGEAATAAAHEGLVKEETEAERRQTLLEPRLSRVRLRVMKEIPGLRVTFDGKTVDRALWSTPFPVDSGPHDWTATASGYVAWATKTGAVEPGTTAAIEVPELQLAQAPISPTNASRGGAAIATASEPVGAVAAPPDLPLVAPQQADQTTAPGTQRILGLVLGATGVLGVGAGGVLALMAKGQYNTASGESGAGRHNDSVSAVNSGNVATAIMAIGGALTVTGGVLWLTAPSAKVSVGVTGNGACVVGVF